MIDVNGLALEGGTKVGFYAYFEDDKIVYDFLEDNILKKVKTCGSTMYTTFFIRQRE